MPKSQFDRRDILIAGGYGVVGQRIAANLAPDFPVVVAGRQLERANAMAAAIGHGVRGRQLNVTDSVSITAALSDVAVVVSCIDQRGRGLLRAAIDRGLCYTDITPHLVELGRGEAYDELDDSAKAGGARVVLGTGIVPGISNVMVRALAHTLGGSDDIETSILLSANDVSGPASLEYLAQELTMGFNVHIAGEDNPARAFGDGRVINFPAPFGPRTAYLFPFSDQVLYPRTTGAKTVRTRLAIEPPQLGRLLALLVRIRAVGGTELKWIRRAVPRQRAQRTLMDQARFALRVDVRHKGQSACMTLVGPAQADAAAAGASATVRALIQGEVSQPGAWMPEQVIDPAAFFSHLAKHGLVANQPN